MKIKNETALPKKLVDKVLETALAAVVALPHWPKPVPAMPNLCILVRNGKNSGITTEVVDPGTGAVGHYLEMCWAANHRNRNTYYADAKDFSRGQSPDITNAMDIFALCAHEIAHCLEKTSGLEGGPSVGPHERRPEEIRVREYERKILFELTPGQWEVIRELAQACEDWGDPDQRRTSFRIKYDSDKWLQNQVDKFWRPV